MPIDDIIENMQSPEFRSLMYDDIIEILLKGGATLELAQYLQFILYLYYKEDHNLESIEHNILSIQESLLGKEKSKRNIQHEIDSLVTFRGQGEIILADVYSDLKLIEATDKHNARMAINRLVARGILEKVDTGRTGTYRMINRSAEETKFLTAPKGEFDVRLPINLNTMCKIFPKNIIIVAGSKSSGKTTLLLNIAIANQNIHKVVYLNSDMGDEEFTDRMIKLGCNNPEDIKFKCYTKTQNYHDMMNGDRAIYIVDFLEIHDKFYEIGKPLKAIHEKLKDGIAVVAIQMKPGATVGRGGDFSKEKSRLYLALDYNYARQCTRVTIEDMKTPKNEEGYKGWYRDVKIIAGSRLSPVSNWLNIQEDKKR